MTFDFTNQTILITGGTRGIGQQIARDLENLGASLILTGTDQKVIDHLNFESTRNGSKTKYLQADFSSPESEKSFFDEIEKLSPIHGLVNNAGINRLNYIDQTELKDWEDMISVNLSTPFKLIRLVSRVMKTQKFGRIVNIGSIFGVISKEKRSIYSATKFGIHGLTVAASNDLARHNILVNTLSPGFVMTDLTKKNLSEAEMSDLSNSVPARRLAQPTDISNVCLFLLSTYNQYLTGQNIIVDGGFTNV